MNNALIDLLFKTFSRNILREYLAPVWRLFQLIFRGIIYSTHTGKVLMPHVNQSLVTNLLSLVLALVTVETIRTSKMADVHVESFAHFRNNVLSGAPSPLPRPYLPSLPPAKTIKPSYSR